MFAHDIPSAEIRSWQLLQLQGIFSKLIPAYEPERLGEILDFLDWLEIPADACLINEGEIGDELFLIISGRMSVCRKNEKGIEVQLGEISRGELVGEIALFTGEQRSATIRALRDSIVVRIRKESFDQIIRVFPQLTTALVKQVVNWMRRGEEEKRNTFQLVNIAILPISKHVDPQAFVRMLQPEMDACCQSRSFSSEGIGVELNESHIAQASRKDFSSYGRLNAWLDERESEYDHLLYVADKEATEWTKRCLRRADEIILLADANAEPDLSLLEESLLHEPNRLTAAPQFLVLQHHPATRRPSNTHKWLDLRPNLRRHYHLKLGNLTFVSRLARILSGTSTGLVLSGGGAKGIAHLGVYRALEEAGLPLDLIGGTSIGSLIGAAIARDLSAQEVIDIYRPLFLSNPTPRSDYNIIPLISVLKGRKIDRMLIEVFGDLGVEDTWQPFFCVSTDLTNHRAEIHRNGKLWRAIRASISLPGIFPPVGDGDRLLVDGGVVNNFPVDVMAGQGVGRIVGVEFNSDKIYDYDRAQIPATWAILRDRLRDRHDRKYRLPSLMSTVVEATLMNSNRKTREWRNTVDVYFNPPVHQHSMLNWSAFDKLVETGYRYAIEKLEKEVVATA